MSAKKRNATYQEDVGTKRMRETEMFPFVNHTMYRLVQQLTAAHLEERCHL